MRQAGVPLPPLTGGPNGAPHASIERAAAGLVISQALRSAQEPRTKRARLEYLAAVILENLPKLTDAPRETDVSELTQTRLEAQQAIAALKRGESVDFYALAVRTGLDILAHGEDKDRATALKFFAPTIKGIDAPKPAEVDDGAAELVSERRNRLAAARDALARGDVEATRTALEGLTDMLDALRVGKAGGA